MATSSSNKMPLLVDRPLHSFATLGGATLTTATNFNTPNGGGCVLLVDCLSNDGAVVDSLSIVAEKSQYDASTISFSKCRGFCLVDYPPIQCAAVPIGSAAPGTRTSISLPPLPQSLCRTSAD